MDTKLVSSRAAIYNLIKEKFELHPFWKNIEIDLAVLHGDLPEVTNEKSKKTFIKGVQKIKDFIISKDIKEADLKFLDEIIDDYKKTVQISLYEEKENNIPPEVINKYANISLKTEGITGIHLPYNYGQLAKLTNGVYKKTGNIKFFISPEVEVYGQITAEFYDTQEVPIATLVERKAAPDQPSGMMKKIHLFGESWDKSRFSKLKEITAPFRVYRFKSDKGKEYVLLSDKELEIGDYTISGVTTILDDFKAITESSKLPTKLPYIFVQSVKRRILQFKDKQDFDKHLNRLKVSKSNMFHFPFTIKKDSRLYLLKHPDWFMWLVWSWILHAEKGLFNKYPFHILMIGPPGGGKSYLQNILHLRSKESQSIFSGSGSTLKSLVPSFKQQPAKVGYLANSNRFSYCDEFLRCFVGGNFGSTDSKDESVAMMNDLLEHQKRESRSGVADIKINMTSRVLATTNPKHGVKDMNGLLKSLDHSFLSRWLIYFQNDEHVDLIRNSKESDLELKGYEITDNDWIAIIDYLNSFEAKLDEDKVSAILDLPKPILSEDFINHYNTRHRHHLEALIDGVAKTRCLLSRDLSFQAIDEDYRKAEEIWMKLISSWIKINEVKKLAIKDRLYFLPEKAQYLFRVIVNYKAPIKRVDIEENVKGELKSREIMEMLIILKDNELIFEDNEFIKPHYMKEE